MSDALFWFDCRIDDPVKAKGKAANGVLNQVVLGFDGKLDPLDGKNYRTSDLWSMFMRPLTHVELKSNFALFMRGTTSDLLEAIDRDLKKDIRRLVFIGTDCVEIRYVRYKAGFNKTVSIVGIAPKDEYWKSVPSRPVEAARHGNKSWADLRSITFQADREAFAEWREQIIAYQEKEREWGKDLKMFVAIDYFQLKPIIENLRDQPAWL